MNGKRYPTQKEINELYEYNSETGLFIYKRRESVRECWNSTYAGKIAGSIDEKGYVRISVNKKVCRAHRIAWISFYGSEPDGEIVHINGIKSDNRICNLRVVDDKQNSRNRKKPINNRSGVIGVAYYKKNKKWGAYINSDNKKIFLGLYDDISLAVNARKLAESRLGYHHNHGRG
ncbi:HNH endonuclease [Escherichia coli]|nr:HNH endonuclease [Escherichia coli]